MANSFCNFCKIIVGSLPSRIRYEDDDIVVFDNELVWVPVMLLLVPKAHMTQSQMWSSGRLMGDIGRLAVKMGEEQCPGGFRILSNFGADAMQSQHHAHLHVIGGTDLGLYVRRSSGHRGPI